MGMSMQSVLGRLFRSKPASPPPRPPFRRKRALFEPLESRLLLSADLNPANEALLSNGLQQLKDWSQGLGAVGELAHKLPGVNTDLGTALDLPALLQSKIVSPIQSYLAQGGTQNTDGIVAALSGIIGVEDVTAFTSGDEIRFDLVLDDTKLLTPTARSISRSTSISTSRSAWTFRMVSRRRSASSSRSTISRSAAAPPGRTSTSAWPWASSVPRCRTARST
jgi:hypothetical protein